VEKKKSPPPPPPHPILAKKGTLNQGNVKKL